MELIVCMFLASLITGFRPVSDMVHALRGQEPPHLTKARLRAETERLRLAAKQAKAESRKPRPGEDKPTLGDVARVYWGDALTDVIAAHDRRRAEKRAQRDEDRAAAEERRPARRFRPRWKERLARLGQMLIRPAGDTDTTGHSKPGPSTPAPSAEPAPSGPIIACDECGVTLADTDGGWRHPAGSTCPRAAEPASAPDSGSADPDRRDYLAKVTEKVAENRRRYPREVCPRCARTDRIIGSGWCETCTSAHPHGLCPDCGGALRFDGDAWRHSSSWGCDHETPAEGHTKPCYVCGTPAPIHPSMAALFDVRCQPCADGNRSTPPAPTGRREARPVVGLVRLKPCYVCGTPAPIHSPQDLYDVRCQPCAGSNRTKPQPPASTPNPDTDRDPTEGDPMTDTMPAATGDAHDVESALNECSLLGDDLTRIDTSLDVIDEAITSAGAAAEKIEAFLKSKSVDDCAVGGMSVARDMLSPTHIKALIDAVAAAKQGVQAAEEELRRLQDLESQLNGADGSVLNGR